MGKMGIFLNVGLIYLLPFYEIFNSVKIFKFILYLV
jgi:hypothetical protein